MIFLRVPPEFETHDPAMDAPCPLLTPTVEFAVALIEKTRDQMLKTVEGLALSRLTRVPPGFRNNLLWNLGHVVATQQILCYEKSGLPPRVPPYLIAPFRKGTSPAEWTGAPEPEDIESWMVESARTLREDLRRNVFQAYTPYETSAGVRLTCLSEALSYTAWHEAQHLGIVRSLRKLV